MNDDSTSLTPTEAEFGSVLDSWIAGTTVSQRSVTIYGNPALMVQAERLLREGEIAAQAAQAEESLGDSRVAEIDQQLEGLSRDLQASKAEWVVRALSEESIAEAKGDDYPEPVPPPALKAQATTVEQAVYAKARAEYERQMEAYSDEMIYRQLSAAIVSIEDAQGRKDVAVFDGDESGRMIKPVATVEQLRVIGRRLGKGQLTKLMAASTRAMAEEPVIKAPFSRSSSSTGRTS